MDTNKVTLSNNIFSRNIELSNWLEDCTKLYVRLICNPAGIGFPDNDSPETTIHVIHKTVQVGNLNQVLQEHFQENIWRSWQLFNDELCSQPVSYVPLFIDIDNEEKNLDDAYSLTRDCLAWFDRTNKFSVLDSLRVVFSGKKGFHIEARPQKATDNQIIRESLINGLRDMGIKNKGEESKNDFIKGTIDTISHEFIRLTGSFNSWKEESVLRKRKVIQLSLDDFHKSGIKGILTKSEVT